MELFQFVEVMTNVTTLCMFATGLPVCWEMLKTKNTRHVPFIFFLLGDINGLCFLIYGLVLKDGTLIFLNGVGVFLNSFYIISYIAVSANKMRPLLGVGCGGIYLSLLYFYLNLVVSPADFADRLGLISAALTCVMMTTPVLEIIDILQRKSTEGISLGIMIGTMMCTVSWYIYGRMLDNPFIYVPNIPGFLFNGTKLVLLFAFSSPGKDKSA